MPGADDIPVIYVWERSAVFLMARVEGLDGVNITQATLSAITMTITKLPSLDVVAPPTPTVADVIFDALRTDRWTVDDTGYNFGHMIDGDAHLTTPGIVHELAYTLTPATGELIRFARLVSPREIHGLV